MNTAGSRFPHHILQGTCPRVFRTVQEHHLKLSEAFCGWGAGSLGNQGVQVGVYESLKESGLRKMTYTVELWGYIGSLLILEVGELSNRSPFNI